MTKRNQVTDEKRIKGDIQRWIVFGMLFLVTLWVSIESVDSTVFKPELLVGLTSLLAAIRLSSVMRAGEIQWYASRADIPILLFLLLSLSVALFSQYSRFAIAPLSQTVAFAICFFAGSQLFREKEQIRKLGSMVAILSAIVCILAIFQYLTAGVFIIDFQLGTSRRVMSTLGNATYLGGFLALLFPFVIGQFVLSANVRGKYLLGLLIAAMAVVLLLTQTRSSMVAALLSVGLLLMSLRMSRPRHLLLGASLLILVCVLVFPLVPTIMDYLAGRVPLDALSFFRRLYFWKAGLAAVADSPLLGHGPGSFALVIPRFRDPGYWVDGSEDMVPHAHNEFLEVAVETGLPGLLLFAIIIALLLRGGSDVAQNKNRWERVTGLSLFFSLFSILIDNMASVSLRQPPVAMVTWLLAGVLLSSAFKPKLPGSWKLLFPGRLRALVPLILWSVFMMFHVSRALERFESEQMLRRGRVAEQTGRHQLAVTEFTKAIDADPLNLVAKLDLCVARLRANKFKDALETSTQLLKVAPFFPKAHLMESLAWLQLDNPDKAKEAILLELRLRDHPEAYYTLSLIEARLDHPDEVRRALEKVLERNISAHSSVHLENSVNALAGIPGGPEDIRRFAALLRELEEQHPENTTIRNAAAELDRRLR